MPLRDTLKKFYICNSLFIFATIISSSNFIDAFQTLDSEFDSLPVKEFVRSYYSLFSLAVHERSIYKVLMGQLNRLSRDVNSETLSSTLYPYLDDYWESSGGIRGQLDDKIGFANIIASHPLLATRMIYRYVLYIKPIITNSEDFRHISGLKSIADDVELDFGWPTQGDLAECWRSILTLHHVHDWNIQEVVRGTVFGTEVSEPMNALHCTAIGKFAGIDGFYALAIDWLQSAKSLVEHKNDTSAELEEIVDSLYDAFVKHDSEWAIADKKDPTLFVEKLITQPDPDLRVKRRTYLQRSLKGQQGYDFDQINFWALCSGEDLRTEKEKMNLFCWYERKSHPYWFINPLKIERIAWSPDAIRIYEVLSNSTISKLINEGIHDLMKSYVHMADGSQPYVKERSSATAFVVESEHPKLAHIPRKIELMTGLRLVPDNSSEWLQLAAYSFGNQYEVHKDCCMLEKMSRMLTTFRRYHNSPGCSNSFSGKKDELATEIGDRIATFMIYLSDAEKGGHTVFTRRGISVNPVKGSAVFWYNLKRNGEPDENSSHGGCPLVVGNKWIANKWIRSHKEVFSESGGVNIRWKLVDAKMGKSYRLKLLRLIHRYNCIPIHWANLFMKLGLSVKIVNESYFENVIM